MVKSLNSVTLDTLEPQDLKVCRDCGTVFHGEGCNFCSLLKKAWKLKDSEEKATVPQMIQWLKSEEEEPEEEEGFFD